MFLYACLVLLPVTALAQCESEIMPLFFDALDSGKDGQVQRTEAVALYNKLNKDGDDCLTLAETQEQAPTVAPPLAGHEPPLYALMDRDKNRCITNSDVDAVYVLMDTNKNGAVSRSEYDTALKTMCLPETISRLLTGLGNNIG